LCIILVLLVGATRGIGAEPDPRTVATFECIGLYWQASGGATENVCEAAYRPVGSREWRRAMPLWFDGRNQEYRGSIVGLRPGTHYEIQLRLGDTGERAVMAAETWTETFPVVRTVSLPARSSDTLDVSEGGSPTGYVVYAPAGESDFATIDVANKADYCVVVKAPYVILRGLKLANAAVHGVVLGEGVHDVLIEQCDISGWGRVMEDGWGRNCDSAIWSRYDGLQRVVVQRNRIHHPRGDSNNWREPRPRPGKREPNHPEGPQAVCFWNSDGNHVIRYNTVFSDDDHQYNDIFGAGSNFSTRGFPNRDSDIYGNLLSHCWDDAIESEGANSNVRIWGNYMTETLVGVACASTSLGPLYVWRNVTAVSRIAPGRTSGGFLKTSDRTAGGRIYVFHNTILQPRSPSDPGKTLGATTGLGWGGPMNNVTSRNNVFNVTRQVFSDRAQDPLGDYDYDLYTGRIAAAEGQEQHGIRGEPVHVPGHGLHGDKATFALSPESPGFDAGVAIPNFNDGFTNKQPDMGAHEAGTAPMKFGMEAYRDAPTRSCPRSMAPWVASPITPP